MCKQHIFLSKKKIQLQLIFFCFFFWGGRNYISLKNKHVHASPMESSELFFSVLEIDLRRPGSSVQR